MVCVCVSRLSFFIPVSFPPALVSPGPSPDGSDGRGTSDGSSADDVQPACPQTHQPLRSHARGPGETRGTGAFIRVGVR